VTVDEGDDESPVKNIGDISISFLILCFNQLIKTSVVVLD
jgi:hypothetical protein